ncbi:tetrapyrrole methylase [Protomyces lactucae-debilis]|uniref:Tetrapyrrole methylase n=1 Tax=Protomyces lactucae-debilis TaxID=2754530 RepID=A0A1Y2FIJ3_PROLT|nr:tetrapyrrole methylase [Protomyces lactucae-debilis]ORY83761.1 tetrapyrrole methylase [Protomyces lactucae-debilis]
MFPTVSPHDSLLVCLKPAATACFLVIGHNRLAAARCFSALEASYKTYVSYAPGLPVDPELLYRIEQGQVAYLETTEAVVALSQLDQLDVVCVTDTLSNMPQRRSSESCREISDYCKRRRIHLNIVDHTDLNTISFPATHRWRTGNTGHALQVAVNTFGKGCRLGTRIKREIISALPTEIGQAVDNVAAIRTKIAELSVEEEEDNEAPLNSPVQQFSPGNHYFQQESPEEVKIRRMKWVAQVSEYWPIKTLGRLRQQDMDRILADFDGTLHALNLSAPSPAQPHGPPRVLLIGSGPGHPGLLTVAAHNAIKKADLILADKLVPSAVLALVPASTELIIAKKFPGNAERAQQELQELALQFCQEHETGTVIRLKQGDPYIYGRGGEEVLFFRKHGIDAIVIPGISSAIAAPLLFDISVTQRGVSDSLILCTGVGRLGKTSIMPSYKRARTLIVLMGVARIGELLTALTGSPVQDAENVTTTREGDAYPPYLPIALIERGSSKDQRMVLSTLAGIEEAIKRVGDQRPPGMLVIGWCCLALQGEGHVNVTEADGIAAGEAGDRARVQAVLGDAGYLVQEGLRENWQAFLEEQQTIM